MDNQLTLYYSLESFGDGSAGAIFFDTKGLAEWHQEHLEEGWGEPCTGEIVVNGNGLSCPELQTKEGYYLELLYDHDNDTEQHDAFVAEFFNEGIPEFTVKIIDHHYYGIFVEGRLVYKYFAYPEKNTNDEGVNRITKRVNRQRTS